MITEPTLMPDFRDGLEQALYRRAVATAPARTMPRINVPRQSLLGRLAVGATVLAAAIAVILTSITGHTPTHQAFADPLIFKASPVPVPPGLKPGAVARLALGPNVRFERVVPVPAFGKTAYLLKGGAGWCLTSPDAPLERTANATGTVCVPSTAIVRTGLVTLLGGGRLLAVLPPGAQAPTIIRADGSRSVAAKSRLGVVAIDGLRNGDRVTVRGADGTSKTFPILFAP